MEKEKILIVDDSALQATQLKSILDDDYDITIAQTGEMGLHYASTESYSLILLDVIMPGMDGFTLLKKLQEEIITQRVPVTGGAAVHDRSAHRNSEQAAVRTV